MCLETITNFRQDFRASQKSAMIAQIKVEKKKKTERAKDKTISVTRDG